MDKDKEQPNEEQQQHKNKVYRKTIHLEDEEIERMPASDDDYRLPRELPEQENADPVPLEEEEEREILTDGVTDISPEEIDLLAESERDSSSDESRTADILEDTDEDGERLNEGPDEDNPFDTGDDLDIPDDVRNPDIDADEDKN